MCFSFHSQILDFSTYAFTAALTHIRKLEYDGCRTKSVNFVMCQCVCIAHSFNLKCLYTACLKNPYKMDKIRRNSTQLYWLLHHLINKMYKKETRKQIVSRENDSSYFEKLKIKLPRPKLPCTLRYNTSSIELDNLLIELGFHFFGLFFRVLHMFCVIQILELFSFRRTE